MKKHILLLSIVLINIALFGRNEASNTGTRGNEYFVITHTFNPEGNIIPADESYRYTDIPFNLWQPNDFSIVAANSKKLNSFPAFSISSLLNSDDIFTGTHLLVSGLTGFTSSDQVIVFPNPSSGKFTITWQNGILKVTVFNMLGNKVFSVTNIKLEKMNEIDLSKFQKGIYFMEIYDGNTIYSEKIVLQ